MTALAYLTDRGLQRYDPSSPPTGWRWRRTADTRDDIAKREGLSLTNIPVGSGTNLDVAQSAAAALEKSVVQIEGTAQAIRGLLDEAATLTITGRTLAETAIEFQRTLNLVDYSSNDAQQSFLTSMPSWVASVLAEARSGNYRLAYRTLYRGLDELFLQSRWQEVASVLERISSRNLPAEFAIGALRFSSDASHLIPRWNAILLDVRARAHSQGLDVSEVLRGLLDDDGSQKRER